MEAATQSMHARGQAAAHQPARMAFLTLEQARPPVSLGANPWGEKPTEEARSRKSSGARWKKTAREEGT